MSDKATLYGHWRLRYARTASGELDPEDDEVLDELDLRLWDSESSLNYMELTLSEWTGAQVETLELELTTDGRWLQHDRLPKGATATRSTEFGGGYGSEAPDTLGGDLYITAEEPGELYIYDEGGALVFLGQGGEEERPLLSAEAPHERLEGAAPAALTQAILHYSCDDTEAVDRVRLVGDELERVLVSVTDGLYINYAVMKFHRVDAPRRL